MNSIEIAKKVNKIRTAIDTDEGLKNKKKYLYITTLMLIFLGVLGGKVTEVNIGIAKFESINLKVLEFFIVMTVIGCIVAYYSYAKPYQKQIKEILHDRLFKDNYFLNVCDFSGSVSGLVYENAPNEFYSDEIGFHNNGYRETTYSTRFPLSRSISYVWSIDGANEPNEVIRNIWSGIGRKKYFMVMLIEAKYSVLRVFDREFLDIYGAYIFAGTAIIAYIFRDVISALIK